MQVWQDHPDGTVSPTCVGVWESAVTIKKLHKLKSGNIMVVMPLHNGRYRTYMMDPDGRRLTPEGQSDAHKINVFLKRNAQ